MQPRENSTRTPGRKPIDENRIAFSPGDDIPPACLDPALRLTRQVARHALIYRLLAPVTKTQRLATARQLLAMSASNPQAREDAQAFMRRVAVIEIACCPHCRVGRWLDPLVGIRCRRASAPINSSDPVPEFRIPWLRP